MQNIFLLFHPVVDPPLLASFAWNKIGRIIKIFLQLFFCYTIKPQPCLVSPFFPDCLQLVEVRMNLVFKVLHDRIHLSFLLVAANFKFVVTNFNPVKNPFRSLSYNFSFDCGWQRMSQFNQVTSFFIQYSCITN